MARGRNEGPEQARIRSGEMGSFRSDGKSGAGVSKYTKAGFGKEKGMQTNRGGKRKTSF